MPNYVDFFKKSRNNCRRLGLCLRQTPHCYSHVLLQIFKRTLLALICLIIDGKEQKYDYSKCSEFCFFRAFAPIFRFKLQFL